MVEQWNSIGGTVEQSGETVMVEQCGGTVQQCNSATVQQCWWNTDSGTVWWNSGIVMVEH